MRVDVYRNLNAPDKTKTWSVKCMDTEHDAYGNVIDHRATVCLKYVTFIVQDAGHEKLLETGVKNVHAFARGELGWEGERDFIQHMWERAYYDELNGEFRRKHDDTRLDGAKYVYLDEEGRMFIDREETK